MYVVEHVLENVIKQVSSFFGYQYIERLMLAFNEALDADYTFVAEIDQQSNIANTVLVQSKQGVLDNFSYDLNHTPCADVSEGKSCIYSANVCAQFPLDHLLIEMGIEAYVGTPFYCGKTNVEGIIVVLFKREISPQVYELAKALFELFSDRIGGEIKRAKEQKLIQQSNQNLEELLSKRALELEKSNQILDLTKHKLFESERLALLGGLVAGIVHDVNTPLGVAITAQSHVVEQMNMLKSKFESSSLTRADLSEFINHNEEAAVIIQRNLERAKDLLAKFKQTATDQHNLDFEIISLADYYQQIVDTLKPLLKNKKVQVDIQCPSTIRVKTCPGDHAQILTNLINNSVMHGFKNKDSENNRIIVSLKRLSEEMIEVDYQDNGCGIADAVIDEIYQPFFTTAKEDGGTGLGMSIIDNVLKEKLQGSITCHAEQEGAHFSYTFTDCFKQSS